MLATLPIERAVQLSTERLLRRRPGATPQARTCNATAPRQLWDWMRCYDTTGYGFSYTQTGPQDWRLQITRRHAAKTPARRRLARGPDVRSWLYGEQHTRERAPNWRSGCPGAGAPERGAALTPASARRVR
jgi:hypothetical protein